MSDSSDDLVDLEVPYSKKPEWADITPISLDTETNEICRIAYTEAFKDVFDYFRAIVKLEEKSERAFELTKDAALLNPANYTVWYYRRILLKELNKDLREELDFISNVIRSHPKNYQVWQHRRNVVECLQDPSEELTFIEKILKRDSKNYHAWQYRQWVIKAFALWQNELDYVNELIELDVRNNSAWNQRFFCLKHQLDERPNESKLGLYNDEIDFCLSKIERCMDNESSWNYLRALVNGIMSLDEQNNHYPPKVAEFCTQKLKLNDEDRSPFLISFTLEYNYNKCKRIIQTHNSNLTEDQKVELRKIVAQSIESLNTLANKLDTIRVNYWNYLTSKWKEEFAEFV